MFFIVYVFINRAAEWSYKVWRVSFIVYIIIDRAPQSCLKSVESTQSWKARKIRIAQQVHCLQLKNVPCTKKLGLLKTLAWKVKMTREESYV